MEYLKARRSGALPEYGLLKALERIAAQTAVQTAESVMQDIRDDLSKEYSKAIAEEIAKLPGMTRSVVQEFQQAIKRKIDSLPAIKGMDGKTPIKNADYFDGYTPQPDIDYLSKSTALDIIYGEFKALEEQIKKTPVNEQERESIILSVLSELDASAVARKLEKLQGAERLDYLALKNRPGVDVSEGQRHVIHRGGGKETYEYDLSSLCDGVTKSFSVPANTRIVFVACSDAPYGFLRKGVDWTGSGTTTLALTGELPAPTEGASLGILYVI